MNNYYLYLISAGIWGSTWFAIKFQLGTVDPAVSLIYRWLIASLILAVFCLIKKLRMRFSLKEHGFMALQGLLLFGVNYWLAYESELYIASGLTAVVVSGTVFMNSLNGAIFLGTPVRKKIVAGGIIGIAGIACIYYPVICSISGSAGTVKGLALSIASAYLASIGTIVSARNQSKGIPIAQSNAYAMLYACLPLFLIAVCSGSGFSLDTSLSYTVSLLYLALFGSVISFGSYLTLIGRVGADKAGYVNLAVPVIALIVSSVFEGYKWDFFGVAGVLLVACGNFIAMNKERFIQLKVLRKYL